MPDLAPSDLLDSPISAAPSAEPVSPTPAEPMSQARTPDGKFGHAHPDFLIEQARDLGLSDFVIFGTPTDVLGRSVNEQRRRIESSIRDLSRERALDVPPSKPAPAEELPDLSHLDETLAATIQKLWSKGQKAEALEKELQAVKQQHQSERVASIGARLDDAFAALPDAYKTFLGDGGSRDIAPEELQFRNLLLGKAKLNTSALPSDRDLKGKLLATAKALFDKTAPQPTKNGKPDTGGYGPSESEWAAGAVQKPTRRTGAAEPDGEQKAIANLTQKMREAGQLPGQGAQAIIDGFLP